MASKRFTWLLTEIAEADVDDILDYIANTLVNPDAATAFADELEEKLNEVCKAPKAGRLVENEFLKLLRESALRLTHHSFEEGNYGVREVHVGRFVVDVLRRQVVLHHEYGHVSDCL